MRFRNLVALFLTAHGCSACAALGLGTPSVATNQCFAYCIDVPVAGKIVAWCYDTKAEQQTALATLNAARVPARLHK
jgi:hypothetical protein